MKIGAYYYPEQWPKDQWKRDFDNMAAMGMQIVHLAEFAWFDLEPKPGDIRLDWLSDVVEMAKERRMDVIMCTPTAAPPVWLSTQHPDVLPVDDTGRIYRFGGRRHYSPTAPALHDATRRIVTAMADRFADHPSIVGWQIDNEYGTPGYFDQNLHAHAAFRIWLKNKYKDLKALNDAWGSQFWNTYYTDFEQILLPPRKECWNYASPHPVLDACRFWSQQYAAFHKMQGDIVQSHFPKRKTKGPLPFITTNFMYLHPDCSPTDFAPHCTMMTWDQYAVGGFEQTVKDETFRISNPHWLEFMHDLMGSYQGRWGLMELQPGQVNWGSAPVLLYPGTIRLWLWTAFAHGAEFVTTYRYRQPLWGIELWHHGLVNTDGVTPSPGGRQFAQVVEEIKRLDLKKIPALEPRNMGDVTTKSPEPTSDVGIVFDFDQLWEYQILPQQRRWNQGNNYSQWHAAIMKTGRKARILHAGAKWSHDLPMIIVPGLQMVDDHDVKQMFDYVAAGGHLVLTCRTALMNRNGHFFEGPTAKPILPLIGGAIEAYDGLPGSVMGKISLDDKSFEWGTWADLLYAEPSTKVLARYADQFYAGAAAVIQKKHEKGIVTYVGVFADESFNEALLAKLLATAPAAPDPKAKKSKKPTPIPAAIPSRVRILRRGPYKILLNYTDKPAEAPAPPNARFHVGNPTVEPAGVAVWEEPE